MIWIKVAFPCWWQCSNRRKGAFPLSQARAVPFVGRLARWGKPTMNYTLETAIVALGAFLALLGAAFAHDSLFAAHMWVQFFTLLVSTV
ncbi:cytochrome-c oxidase, cbb3-type subunit I, partial [Agrobacterium sp. CR_3]